MAEPAQKHWRPEDVQELPYGRIRYECIHGELLVTPSPRRVHQEVVLELAIALKQFLAGVPGLHIAISPADIQLEPDTLVQPDVFVERDDGPVDLNRPWKETTRLALAIEVLSPGSRRFDRGMKRELYMRADVSEYWIVDPDERMIERWVKGAVSPTVLRETLLWHPPESAMPFLLDIQRLL